MAKRKEEFIDNSTVYEKNLEEVMHSSMIPYSEYVIMDRALPRVEDGLKPVQRRILYTLHELGITPDKPYKKSARIVGDCLGKYHPHGDTSVYDAMVRMAQPFNMRMPLVDGHGNFGSPDGDGAAAMRYTEARMGVLAQQLLRDLDKDTVSWSWNFDDSLKEPDMLPGRFPNLLVNGASGIAIGLSSNIPTHNLGEVIDGVIAVMENPRISLKDMMKTIPGPDFPTGGYIVGGDGLVQAYETGKGKIIIKAKLHIEDAENDKKNIVITEMPYQVNKTAVLKKIVELSDSSSPTKKEAFSGIVDVVDESDRDGIRAVIKVKREADVNKIVANLYKSTDLQKSFAINMVAIADAKPRQLGLMEILKYYLAYQVTIIVRRTKYDLKIAKNRAEVVRGLLIAIANIDEVIRIIKKAPSTPAAREQLMARFKLSELQASAILEMKLKALTRLEHDKLADELKELEEKIAYYTLILSSQKEQYKVIKGELLEIKKMFKEPRKSKIAGNIEEVIVPVKSNEVEYREGVFIVSADGCFKVISQKNYSMSQTEIADCDVSELATAAEVVSTRDTVYAFSNLGNCFKISIGDFPEKKWRDKPFRLAEIHKDAAAGERIVKIIATEVDPIGEVVIMTKKGMVKRTSWQDLILQKTAYQVMKLSGDEVISVEVYDKPNILMITKEGQYIAFSVEEVPVQGRVAGGVGGVTLAPKDEVVLATLCNDDGEVVVVSSVGFAKRVIMATIETGTRKRKGNKIIDFTDFKGAYVVYAGIVKQPYDLALITGDEIKAVSTESIDITARTTRGKAVIKKKVERVVRHYSKLQ